MSDDECGDLLKANDLVKIIPKKQPKKEEP